MTREGETEKDTMMDFGILLLNNGERYRSSPGKERAFLLMKGEVVFSWGTEKEQVKRNSLFDEEPVCLHVPANIEVTIESKTDFEIAIFATTNNLTFEPRFYQGDDTRSEHRGKGTMRETSTRIVRTIFDISNAPNAKLVLGEVVNFPGKWSSYPPHHHPQPEIYHYRFLPEQGFGFGMLGEDVYKIKHGDTLKILDDRSHPQVSAPGYAMYYIWAIRHLDGNPYTVPTFEPEHLWVSEKDAPIWPHGGE
ncbi:5-deoxyglucuronate isomerase [Kosmotoga pacifica]|uniref:5-deoxyglucuronate isomerase n=1 Tax=Kosmotoga pacifica TaxID=1330330 RepID=A0A0G2ZE23_9BACT|nr:5-deoxyglucuronate isomerase [Kosmotoga pacifica]